MKDVYILAIETSCDETSIAIVKNGNECVYMNVLTQMDTHANFGGVVPEIASRMHTENITMVLEDVLSKSNIKIDQINAIAVTYAPGLMGSLLVGVEFAKTLAYLWDKPLIPVNHMAGHIYANNLTNKLTFPLLAIVVSGGHTNLIMMEDDYKFSVIGSTLDDAIGEAYDKVARVLGVKYPGGPNVEKLAKDGQPTYNLGTIKTSGYDMSYSGLKSSVINLVHNEKQRGNEINKNDLACSFQTIAVGQIVQKTKKAIKEFQIKNIIVAGGVSANNYLRNEISKLCDEYNVNLSIPEFKYCTDNAAMIGAAAYPLFINKKFSDFSLNASSSDEIF